MKLQIALDTCDIKESLDIIHEVNSFIDIVEIGTPMIINYGVEAVRVMKKKFPVQVILADTKIMDAGEFEAEIAFRAGADIISVMGITNDETIKGAVRAAKSVRGKVLADMMCVKNLEERAKELIEMGVNYVCVHTATDVQRSESPFKSLAAVQQALGSKYTAIAGGINCDSIHKILPYRPEIVVIGNGITGEKNKHKSAEYMKRLIV